MLEKILDERFQRSICFLLLADYCTRMDASNPMGVADAMLEQFAETIRFEIQTIKPQEAGKTDEAEAELMQYIEKWRTALFQQFTIYQENSAEQ